MRTLSIAIMGMLMATMKHFTRPLAVTLIVLGFAAQAQGPFQVKVTAAGLSMGLQSVGQVELRGQTTPDAPCSNGAYGDVFPLSVYLDNDEGTVTASLYPGLCNVSWLDYGGGGFSFWLHEDGCLVEANGCTLTVPLQSKVSTNQYAVKILFAFEVLDGNCGTQNIAGLTSQEVDSGFKGDTGDKGDTGTDGTQGPQGKVGATGVDADCVACADVANGAVDLACLVLGENLPTRVGQVQAAATVIVNTLLISTNICEPTCDIGAEIDALIDAKMNP
jgi:hypothetical protein